MTISRNLVMETSSIWLTSIVVGVLSLVVILLPWVVKQFLCHLLHLSIHKMSFFSATKITNFPLGIEAPQDFDAWISRFRCRTLFSLDSIKLQFPTINRSFDRSTRPFVELEIASLNVVVDVGASMHHPHPSPTSHTSQHPQHANSIDSDPRVDNLIKVLRVLGLLGHDETGMFGGKSSFLWIPLRHFISWLVVRVVNLKVKNLEVTLIRSMSSARGDAAISEASATTPTSAVHFHFRSIHLFGDMKQIPLDAATTSSSPSSVAFLATPLRLALHMADVGVSTMLKPLPFPFPHSTHRSNHHKAQDPIESLVHVDNFLCHLDTSINRLHGGWRELNATVSLGPISVDSDHLESFKKLQSSFPPSSPPLISPTPLLQPQSPQSVHFQPGSMDSPVSATSIDSPVSATSIDSPVSTTSMDLHNWVESNAQHPAVQQQPQSIIDEASGTKSPLSTSFHKLLQTLDRFSALKLSLALCMRDVSIIRRVSRPEASHASDFTSLGPSTPASFDDLFLSCGRVDACAVHNSLEKSFAVSVHQFQVLENPTTGVSMSCSLLELKVSAVERVEVRVELNVDDVDVQCKWLQLKNFQSTLSEKKSKNNKIHPFTSSSIDALVYSILSTFSIHPHLHLTNTRTHFEMPTVDSLSGGNDVDFCLEQLDWNVHWERGKNSKLNGAASLSSQLQLLRLFMSLNGTKVFENDEVTCVVNLSIPWSDAFAEETFVQETLVEESKTKKSQAQAAVNSREMGLEAGLVISNTKVSILPAVLAKFIGVDGFRGLLKLWMLDGAATKRLDQPAPATSHQNSTLQRLFSRWDSAVVSVTANVVNFNCLIGPEHPYTHQQLHLTLIRAGVRHAETVEFSRFYSIASPLVKGRNSFMEGVEAEVSELRVSLSPPTSTAPHLLLCLKNVDVSFSRVSNNASDSLKYQLNIVVGRTHAVYRLFYQRACQKAIIRLLRIFRGVSTDSKAGGVSTDFEGSDKSSQTKQIPEASTSPLVDVSIELQALEIELNFPNEVAVTLDGSNITAHVATATKHVRVEVGSLGMLTSLQELMVDVRGIEIATCLQKPTASKAIVGDVAVEVESVRWLLPHSFHFNEFIFGVQTLQKCLKQCLVDDNGDAYSPDLSMPTPNILRQDHFQNMPTVTGTIKSIVISFLDDPFDASMNRLFRLGQVEQKRRLARYEAFDKKVAELEHGGSTITSALPASATPTIARPFLARPASAAPTSSRPTSALPTSPGLTSPGLTSATSHSQPVSSDRAWFILEAMNSRLWRSACITDCPITTAKKHARVVGDLHNEPAKVLILDASGNPGLFNVIATHLHFTLSAPTLSSPTVEATIHDLDSATPADLCYELLLACDLKLSWNYLRIWIRDFPQPLCTTTTTLTKLSGLVILYSHVKDAALSSFRSFVHISGGGDCDERGTIASTARDTEDDDASNSFLQRIQGTRVSPALNAFSIGASRKHKDGAAGGFDDNAETLEIVNLMALTKFCGSLRLELPQTTEIHFSPCLEPNLNDLNRIMRTITLSSVDLSPPLPFWDRLRAIMSGRLFLFSNAGDVIVSLGSGRSVYENESGVVAKLSNGLKLWVGEWMDGAPDAFHSFSENVHPPPLPEDRGPIRLSCGVISVSAKESRENSMTFARLERVKVDFELGFECLGTGKRNDLMMRAPPIPRLSTIQSVSTSQLNVDSFAPIRSRSISMKLRVHSDAEGWNGILLSRRALKVVQNLAAQFSARTSILRIRNGPLFYPPPFHPPQLQKISRFIRSVDINWKLPSLLAEYRNEDVGSLRIRVHEISGGLIMEQENFLHGQRDTGWSIEKCWSEVRETELRSVTRQLDFAVSTNGGARAENPSVGATRNFIDSTAALDDAWTMKFAAIAGEVETMQIIFTSPHLTYFTCRDGENRDVQDRWDSESTQAVLLMVRLREIELDLEEDQARIKAWEDRIALFADAELEQKSKALVEKMAQWYERKHVIERHILLLRRNSTNPHHHRQSTPSSSNPSHSGKYYAEGMGHDPKLRKASNTPTSHPSPHHPSSDAAKVPSRDEILTTAVPFLHHVMIFSLKIGYNKALRDWLFQFAGREETASTDSYLDRTAALMQLRKMVNVLEASASDAIEMASSGADGTRTGTKQGPALAAAAASSNKTLSADVADMLLAQLIADKSDRFYATGEDPDAEPMGQPSATSESFQHPYNLNSTVHLPQNELKLPIRNDVIIQFLYPQISVETTPAHFDSPQSVVFSAPNFQLELSSIVQELESVEPSQLAATHLLASISKLQAFHTSSQRIVEQCETWGIAMNSPSRMMPELHVAPLKSAPKQKRMDAWPAWIPIESLIDEAAPTGWFHRILNSDVGKISVLTHNPLFIPSPQRVLQASVLRNDVRAETLDSMPMFQSDPEEAPLCNFVHVDFPNLHLQSNSVEFSVLTDIIANLLVFTDPDKKKRMEKEETLRFAILKDEKGLQGVVEYVQRLQERIRRGTMLLEGEENEERLMQDAKENAKLFYQNLTQSMDSAQPTHPMQSTKTALLRSKISRTRAELRLLFGALKRVLSDRVQSSTHSHVLHLNCQQLNFQLLLPSHHPICTLRLCSFDFEATNSEDGSVATVVEIQSLELFTPTSSSHFDSTQVLSAYSAPKATSFLSPSTTSVNSTTTSHLHYAHRKMIRVYWKELAAVAGIQIIDHFEVNIHPLQLQLSYHLAMELIEFLYPKKPELAKVPSRARRGEWMRRKHRDSSATSIKADESKESGSGESAVDSVRPNAASVVDEWGEEAEMMKDRASSNRTFVYIKVPGVTHCLSYHGKRDTNLEDLDRFVLRLPTLEYHNRTWSWLEFALQVRREVLVTVVSQTGSLVREKLSLKNLRHRKLRH